MTKMMNSPQSQPDEVVEAVRDYKTIREEYRYDPSIFSFEDTKISTIKWIIEHKLTQADRTIIILYMDCLSTRKLGKRFRISHTLAAQQVKRIREIILKEYELIKDKDI